MRPKSFTITASAAGTTYSPAMPLNFNYNDPFNVGIGVQVIYGTTSALYDVQHTFSDPWAINLNTAPGTNTSATGIWVNNATLASASTTGDTNYAFPVRAVRLALRAAASAQVTITVLQGGPM